MPYLINFDISKFLQGPPSPHPKVRDTDNRLVVFEAVNIYTVKSDL